jgi:hypothetical protein
MTKFFKLSLIIFSFLLIFLFSEKALAIDYLINEIPPLEREDDFEKEPQRFSFAIITDFHLGRGYPDYDSEGFEDEKEVKDYYLTERLKKVIDWINENKEKIDCKERKCPIQFVIVLGDIADSAEISEFQKAKEILDKLGDPNEDKDLSDGIPYLPIFGNHDVWPYTESKEATFPLGEEYFEKIFWHPSSTNYQLIKKYFKDSFKRQEDLPEYQSKPYFHNFAFSFGGINFIGLDFNSREHVLSPGWKTGIKPEAENYKETLDWLKDCLRDHKECQREGKENPTIIFSHHPFIKDSLKAFSPGKWICIHGGCFYQSGEFNEIEEIIKDSPTKILANFAGHVHGFYPIEIMGIELPHPGHFMDANEEKYPSISTTPVITTEALMVGSNEKDEYLKKHNKGLIRIVKVLSENEIDYKTIEGRYNPETGEGKEFIALNPYMSFDYKSFSGEPCMIFKGHAFTKREHSLFWKVNDSEIGSGKKVEYCFPEAPKDYQVELKAVDKENPDIIERIIQKIKIKLGIIPKLLKIKEKMKEKIELISTTLGENLTKIGRTIKDTVLVKVKHSDPLAVGILNVHFEQATKDIDLTNLIADFDIEKKKSILYMPEWPAEIENSKILFVPK